MGKANNRYPNIAKKELEFILKSYRNKYAIKTLTRIAKLSYKKTKYLLFLSFTFAI